MAGIMDLFRGFNGGNTPGTAQPPQNPATAPGTPGNLPLNAPPMVANGSPDGQVPPQQQQEKAPLDDFMKLWDTPSTPSAEPTPLSFAIDPSKVQAAAKGIDFTKVISQETLAKVNAGGEGAQAAMLEAMNQMAQGLFSQTMMANTKILESSLESSRQNTLRSVPGAVRKASVSNALREDNPLFTNPATAPMLQMVEAQLMNQYPNATPSEIKDHARRYLTGFAAEAAKLNPQDQQSAKANQLKDTDWSQVEI